jgi:hypothetical protein
MDSSESPFGCTLCAFSLENVLIFLTGNIFRLAGLRVRERRFATSLPSTPPAAGPSTKSQFPFAHLPVHTGACNPKRAPIPGEATAASEYSSIDHADRPNPDRFAHPPDSPSQQGRRSTYPYQSNSERGAGLLWKSLKGSGGVARIRPVRLKSWCLHRARCQTAQTLGVPAARS